MTNDNCIDRTNYFDIHCMVAWLQAYKYCFSWQEI